MLDAQIKRWAPAWLPSPANILGPAGLAKLHGQRVAAALLESPRVAWVGVSDVWAASRIPPAQPPCGSSA